MVTFLSHLLGLLPLNCVQQIGATIARMMAIVNPSYYTILRDNLATSGLFRQPAHFEEAVKTNIIETGKSLFETLKIWRLSDTQAAALVKNVYGWAHVEQALAAQKGIIFLTPHLGCFEITSLFYAAQHPITVLYRPPRQNWLLPLIVKGRTKGKVKLAPANSGGVRLLMQALKNGEAIGILPDQTPKSGEGEWAPFFGKPAYTMTLASRIAEKTHAKVILAFGKRLPNGAGYDLHLTALEQGAIATPTLLNSAIEKQIAAYPEQYLWRYNRYKSHRNADKKRQATQPS